MNYPETMHARHCAYVVNDGPAPCTCAAGAHALIPLPPVVIEPTPAESRLLRMAQGGRGALKGCADHRIATELEERGLLKVVSDHDDRTYWRLSGDGFKLAEMAAAEAMRERVETRP